MPKFCPNCGAKLKFEEAKFCSGCGFKLEVEREKTLAEIAPPEVKKTEELGRNFEKFVEEILQTQGYRTQRNVKRRDESGSLAEFDIVAAKGSSNKAIECKNWDKPVPVKEIRDFVTKSIDRGISPYLFVAYSGFSEDARKYAESRGIRLWTFGDVKENYALTKIGRLGKSQKVVLENAAPINVDFEAATKLNNIQNSHLVKKYSKLIWKPYYVISYVLDAYRKDPTRKLHHRKDSGKCIINAIDGEIVTFIGSRISEGLLPIFGSIRKDKEREMVPKQLKANFIKNFTVSGSEDFEVSKFDHQIEKGKANRIAVHEIIKRNTKDLSYEVKDEESILGYERRSLTFIPRKREVLLKSTQLVFVPKWSVIFESADYDYEREVWATSGDVTIDSISSCPEHLFRKHFLKKGTIAVCEVCGKALCDEHVHQCPICSKWFGVEHSTKCNSCGRFFCKDHVGEACYICGEMVCNDCLFKCPICGNIACKNDRVACVSCGRKVCKKCTKAEKKLLGLKKKYMCKECVNKK